MFVGLKVMPDHNQDADVIRQALGLARSIALSGEIAGQPTVGLYEAALARLHTLERELEEARLEWPASVRHFRHHAKAAEARVHLLKQALEGLIPKHPIQEVLIPDVHYSFIVTGAQIGAARALLLEGSKDE